MLLSKKLRINLILLKEIMLKSNKTRFNIMLIRIRIQMIHLTQHFQDFLIEQILINL